MGQLRRDDSDRFFDYSLHVPTRTIYVGGEVEEEMSEFFLKAMHLLLRYGQEKITIIMNSGGGDEYHGLAVYDSISCSTAPITMIMYGHAMSMGSWIPQAADERIMSPHCTMMLHYGTWGYEENAHIQKAVAAENIRLSNLMEECYLERIREKNPRFRRDRLKKMLIDETYLSAQKAVDLGLADRILEDGWQR